MDRYAAKPISISIAAVERDTGISKDTLRVWERRYGFPTPGRDEFGERAYPLEQIEKLRLLKRLMDAGHRPGKIVGYSTEELQRLSEGVASAPLQAGSAGEVQDLRQFLELVKTHDVEELRRALSQALLRGGLARFVMEVAAPLNTMVGEAWMRGYFEIFEEHLYTETMQTVLRNAINTIPEPPAGAKVPRVLLTTFPQEGHGLGLLMAEAMFALDGCKCLSLGTQTPIFDIVLAAQAQRADIVALSFSAALNPNQVIEGLRELREKLPPRTQVWAGGSCPALHRKQVPGVLAIAQLGDVPRALQDWRAAFA
jgi:DNA-binding transcriptional MerR regulator/methylmalonyl-CoA mutase cobalamin-binding subunit